MDAGSSDDDLLDELRGALASGRGPAANRLAADARAAFSFRTMEEELAGLAYDSAAEPERASAGRATAQARTLVFTSSGLSVEMEIVDGDIVGQVAPAGLGTITIETPDGLRRDVDADELGCFSTTWRGGLLRIRVPTAAGVVVTDWVRVDDLRNRRR